MLEKLVKPEDVQKSSEFPQDLPHPKGKLSRNERRKTLPVTADELNAIPEGELASISKLSQKPNGSGYRDSRADSGILSGSSDVENYYDTLDRDSLTSADIIADMETNEDDPARLSVSAKASIFKQLEEKSKTEKPKSSASGAKRYIDRKKRERCRTQPITEDEVKDAAEIADAPENSEKLEDKSEEIQKEIQERKQLEDEGLADDLSRLVCYSVGMTTCR